MRTFIIVDDELLVRVGVRSLVDRETCGYALAGEAVNGDEAFDLVTSVKPDILLTDLVMPGSDGFSLIDRIRSAGINIGIIVLSCHNDFENMREALRLGADDFVFKPTLNKKELLEVFDRVYAKIALAAGSETAGTRADRPARTGTEKRPGAFAALKRPFRILAVSFIGAEAPADILWELRRQDPSILAVTVSGDTAFLALENGGRQSLASSFGWVREYALRYLGCGVLGTVSTLVSADEEAESAADGAERLLRTACYGPGKALVFADDANPAHEIFQGDKYAASCGELSRSVDLADLPRIRTALASLADSLRITMDAVRIRSLLADALVIFKIRDCDSRYEPATRSESGSVADIISLSPSLDEAIAGIAAYAETYVLEAKKRMGMRPEIDAVCRWVLTDLSRVFSVEDAASVAAMSPSHFAHVFKYEMKTSFIDFVNQSRMEKARELLLMTNLLVREISDRVGFRNANYFCTLFKKYSGLTPHEVREGKTKEE